MLDFAVIGGGPVGLMCAVALRRLGRSVTVLEQGIEPRLVTRSIGIHATSLAYLDELGVLAPFLARGVRIERGVAMGSRGRLGALDFGDAATRFGYALSVPQPQTEAVLEDAARRSGARLLRGATFHGLEQRRDHVALAYDRHGERRTLTARYLLGCDGAHSRVRDALGVATWDQRHPGTYLMAEFPGTPALGRDAWVFLADEGLVESFPLPGDQRRWVVEAPARRERVELSELCGWIHARSGHRLNPHTGGEASVFGVKQRLAEQFRCDRVLLLGDAAHVLSPFGGQGMNLGWLDVAALAETTALGWAHGRICERGLNQWADRRRRAAQAALRQAAWNTRMGRRTRWPRLRNALIRLVLSAVLAPTLRRRIAMRGLA